MIARHCPASILVPWVAERSVAMPLDYDKLLNWRPPEVRQKLTRKDTILYALGLGLGADPMDERQLRFVYEKDLLALPTIATVLASTAFWMKAPEFDLDWHKILHGEEAFEISMPIPAEGNLIGRTRVAAIVEKSADKGALALIERTISEAQTGQTIATVKSTAFMRSYGGFGGPSGPTPELHQLPSRGPDLAGVHHLNHHTCRMSPPLKTLAVDARRGVPFKRQAAPLQEIDGDARQPALGMADVVHSSTIHH